MSRQKRILVVDDDAAMNSLLKDFLQRLGYAVFTFRSMAMALEWLGALKPEDYPDVVLSDIKLGPGCGMELTRTLKKLGTGIPVILFSVEDGLRDEALKSGARLFLQTPFRLAELAKILENEWVR